MGYRRYRVTVAINTAELGAKVANLSIFGWEPECHCCFTQREELWYFGHSLRRKLLINKSFVGADHRLNACWPYFSMTRDCRITSDQISICKISAAQKGLDWGSELVRLDRI